MADHLQMSVKAFRADVIAKQIPHIPVGKRGMRFDPLAVEAYLAGLVVKETATIIKFKPRVAVKGKSKFSEACGI